MSLTFEKLREVNKARAASWTTSEPWSVSDHGMELLEELGEVAGALKKLRRIATNAVGNNPGVTREALIENLRDEFGDTQICLDKLAFKVEELLGIKIDLGECTAAKFNKTSKKVGLPQRL